MATGTPCERHPEWHTATCGAKPCERPAVAHVNYGSGCANLCDRHVKRFVELRAVTVRPL